MEICKINVQLNKNGFSVYLFVVFSFVEKKELYNYIYICRYGSNLNFNTVESRIRSLYSLSLY